MFLTGKILFETPAQVVEPMIYPLEVSIENKTKEVNVVVEGDREITIILESIKYPNLDISENKVNIKLNNLSVFNIKKS